MIRKFLLAITLFVGSLTAVAQQTSNALNFQQSGTPNYVTGINANLPQGNSARTIEMWMKTFAVLSNWEVLMNWGMADHDNIRASLMIHPEGKLYYAGENNDLEGTSVITDGSWHHVAMSYDGTTTTLYVDGNLEATQNSPNYNTTGTTFDLGKRINETSEYFDGSMDEIRVWNFGKTQAQIIAQKNMELTGTETGLVAYYNCNQGIANGTNPTITTLIDKSPSAANGILNNFALTGRSSNWVGWTTVNYIYYVDSSMTDNTGNGLTWATAKKDITDALSLSMSGDSVFVKAGTYMPPISGSFSLVSGVKVFGGFNGTETMLNQRNWVKNKTVLQGSGGTIISNSSGLSTLTTLSGFTITGGRGVGGSISLSNNSNPIIENCIISGNYEGCVFIYSSPSIINCLISGNSSQYYPQIYSLYGNPIFINCTISGNVEGGIINFAGHPNVTNCIIWNNISSGNQSIGIQDTDGSSTVTNSNIQGGIYIGVNNISEDPIFVNPIDPSEAPTDLGDYRLRCTSTSLGAGTTIGTPTNDILNAFRSTTAPTLGAFEQPYLEDATLYTTHTTQTLIQSGVTIYGSCTNLLAKLESTGSSPIIGSTTVQVWIDNTQNFVKRHYQISPAANASTATGTLTLYFTQPEFDLFNALNSVKLPTSPTDAVGISNLLIEKRSGVSNDGTGLPNSYTGGIVNINPADTSIIWNETASRWEITFDVTGFSGFFVKTNVIILPINWLSINGYANNQKQAIINWQVQESNVSKYQVEKSNDGIHFSSIANIVSKGNGTNNYTYTEPIPLQTVTFYRILQTDKDGKSSYSQVVKINMTLLGGVAIYPNPIKNMATLQIGNNSLLNTTAILTDMNGKLLQNISITQPSTHINLSNYACGIYLLKLQTNEVIKLIKE